MERWKQTKLGSGLTIASWERISGGLEPGIYDRNWEIVISAIEDRFTARFIEPADAIQSWDKKATSAFPGGRGFAIVALDCLLLESLNGYETGSSSNATAATFHKLLTTKSQFAKSFSPLPRAKAFGWAVRHGLLHDGETRQGWIIRQGTIGGPLVQSLPDNRVVLYRDAFHAAVKACLAEYFAKLRNTHGLEGAQLRKAFMNRLNSLSRASAPPHAIQ